MRFLLFELSWQIYDLIPLLPLAPTTPVGSVVLRCCCAVQTLDHATTIPSPRSVVSIDRLALHFIYLRFAIVNVLQPAM